MQNVIPLVLGGSWASGVNLYLTAAGLGIAQRMHWVQLPGDMGVLGHPLVIGLAVLMYGVEFVADKIPFVDNLWDTIHTFIRPAGGAGIGYLAASQADPVVQTGVAMLTGTLALGSHLTKATTRSAINTTTMGVGAPVASVAEDATVCGVLYLIIKHPIIATLVLIGLIVLCVWLLRMFFRFLKRLFHPVKKGEIPATDKGAAVSVNEGGKR